MTKYSKREHDMAIAAATAEATAEIQVEMQKSKNYDPMLGLEMFSEAYEHALDLYSGNYPD